jgi:hypothetical protein
MDFAWKEDRMKKLSIVTALLLALAAPTASGNDRIRVKLIGYEEVPAVSTAASGRFRAQISDDELSIAFKLTYTGLQGTVAQAHIHVGQRSVNGGIVLWLCGTATNPGPAGTQTCPVPMPGQEAEVSGTLDAGDVVAITGTNAGQQISAGELAEVIAAIRAGVAYVNVHTSLSPGGEIRAQIGGGQGQHDHDD